MFKTVIAIFFMVQGEPIIMQGWEPRELPNQFECIKEKINLDIYIKMNGKKLNLPTEYHIFCGKDLDEIDEKAEKIIRGVQV